ncbi:MAG: MFS transporter, partial [Tumebacillaceae bacterium]
MTFKSLHRNVKIRMFEGFFNNLLGNMVYPFMVIYFAQHFGAAITGGLMTVNVVLSMIASIYGGYMSDRYGRKNLMLIAQVSFFISFLGMAYGNSPWYSSAVLTYAMSALNGVSSSFMGPSAQAMLIDVTTAENRKYVYGVNYWTMNLAVSIAAFVGGFLFQTHRFGLLLTLACCSFLSMMVLVFFIQETYKPSAEKLKASADGVFKGLIRSYKTVVKDKTFLIYATGGMLLGSIEFQSRNYTAVRLAKEFGTQTFFGHTMEGTQMFGLLASENSILVVALGLIITKIVNRKKDSKPLLFGVITTSIGFAVMGVTNSPLLSLLSMGLATIGEMVWVPIAMGLSAELPDPDNRSAYM